MAPTLVVAQGGCVRLPAGKVRKGNARPVLYQGEVIPGGLFTDSQLKEHLKSGYIVPMNRTEIVDPASLPASTEKRPGETIAPPITAGKKGDNTEGSDPVTTAPTGPATRDVPDVNDGPSVPISAPVIENANAAAEAAPAPGPVVNASGNPVSKFIFDPATLQDKSVEELNVLIKQCDETIDPMDTAAEAIALLSQDFVVGLSVR